MPKIGFTHGALYRLPDKFSPRAFEAYAKSGSELLEICWNNLAEGERLMEVAPFAKQYPRTSIHLPSDVRYANDDVTKAVLDKAFELYQAIGAELVVVHPDLIDSTELFGQYPMNFSAENMDCRNKAFKNVDDLKKFFEENDSWGMVLDLNHCFSNDPSMKLADEFIAEFRARIKQLHISGYAGYHEPLYQTQQLIILDYAKQLDVPMVIESTFDAIEEVKTEFEYITGYLRAG